MGRMTSYVKTHFGTLECCEISGSAADFVHFYVKMFSDVFLPHYSAGKAECRPKKSPLELGALKSPPSLVWGRKQREHPCFCSSCLEQIPVLHKLRENGKA